MKTLIAFDNYLRRYFNIMAFIRTAICVGFLIFTILS